MWVADNWKDYEIIDTGCGRKLERFGKFILDRPDPQVVWSDKSYPDMWQANAIYHRSKKGGGSWEINNLPESWKINYSFLDGEEISFNLKPFSFKHTGIFPEQAVNWEWMYDLIKSQSRPIKVLNLFAYTGGATLACAKAGASVTHLDASKGIVNWAKENALISGLSEAPIRYLFDDASKFIMREIRRENTYDAIIMDPPSYGRGPKGEIWQMEDMIYDFVKLCRKVLNKKPLFLLLNSYTTGLAPAALLYMLRLLFKEAHISSDEIGIPVSGNSDLVLPCGASSRVIFN